MGTADGAMAGQGIADELAWVVPLGGIAVFAALLIQAYRWRKSQYLWMAMIRPIATVLFLAGYSAPSPQLMLASLGLFAAGAILDGIARSQHAGPISRSGKHRRRKA